MSTHKEGAELKAIKKNPWMLSTIIVSVVAVILIIMMVAGGSMGGKKKAEQNLVSFAASQGGDLEVLSTTKEGGMYKVRFSYNGQESEVFVSLDGNYLIQAPIPISDDAGAVGTQQPTPQQDVPKSDKPNVELFIMSYCPYGTQTQKGILAPAGLLAGKIDFKVRWVDYIMHGVKESDENTVQYCIQKEQNTKYFDYAKCFLTDGNTSRCLVNASINQAMLNTCIANADKEFKITETMEGSTSQFPKYLVDTEDAQKYGVQGSPTLVINGVQVETGRSPAALLSTICSAFNNAPAECNTQLSTASPAPGFGWDAAAASDVAAYCG